jgi:copper transport protein
VRRNIAIVLMAGFGLVLATPVARAHGLVRESNPADGAVLEKPPASVQITFTEPPDLDLSVIQVLDSTGRPVETGEPEPVPRSRLGLQVALGPVDDGVYTVTWRTVSEVDGHVTGGSFTFGVGVSPAAVVAPTRTNVGPTTPSPTTGEALARWALYWGLAVLVSAAVVGSLVYANRLPNVRFILVGAWVVSAIGLAAMVVAERSSVGVSLGRLLSSGHGRGLVREAIALGIAGIAVAFAAARPGRISLLSVGTAAAAAMWFHAEAGHAAAAGSLRWFDVAVQWVHLLAVAVWIGGLLWLLLAIRGREKAERAEAVQRFSWLAGIALATVVSTGLLRALDEVGGPASWRRLFDTSFGIALMIKVGLIAGLITLGARNRYVNVPGIVAGKRPTASLRRTVGGELLVAAAILGVTGVLTQLPPASSVASAAKRPVSQQVVVRGNDFATSMRVRLIATPGSVGPNRFAALVTDYDTGRPVEADRVSLRFSLTGRPEVGSPTLELSRARGEIWGGQGTVISMDGRWNISVLVQGPTGSVEVPLALTPRLPPQRIQVTRAPGQPTLYTIALAGRASLQAYVDPGSPGTNAVHFTFFQASGEQQPIASASATAVTPAGSAEDLPLMRFDAAHFVANTSLEAGHWRFRIQAATREGTVYDAYIEQHLAG